MSASVKSPKPGRRPTIVDVARLAEVSPSAVSKVLRDTYGVSAAMRERVSSAMDTLGYRPMMSARGMRAATRTLGVSSLNPHNPFLPMLLDGVAQETRRSGYASLITLTDADGATQLESARSMVDRQMDGLILITPTMSEGELESLVDDAPFVLLGRHGAGQGYDSVSSDDALGSQLVVDHLVAQGHRSIVFHTQPTRSPGLPEQFRLEGYQRAMHAHGLTEDIVVGEWSTEGGAALAAQLMSRPHPPSAVHAGADMAALGALSWLWDRGHSTPGDLAVVGCDDVPAAGFEPISLTTIDQHAQQLGELAARLLIERLAGRTEPRHVLVPPRLQVRRSA